MDYTATHSVAYLKLYAGGMILRADTDTSRIVLHQDLNQIVY